MKFNEKFTKKIKKVVKFMKIFEYFSIKPHGEVFKKKIKQNWLSFASF